MRALFALPPRRALEATPEQVAAVGASLGSYGLDPVDGDRGYRPAGSAGRREVPGWTRERARTASVAAYRTNPMATAIVDTYIAFAVGDKGVSLQVSNQDVREVAEEFWSDPANNCAGIQEIALRSQLLLGEKLYQMLVGGTSGVVRFCAIDPTNITDVTLRHGNAMWPDEVVLGAGESELRWKVVRFDDEAQLREGEAMFWAPWRTLDTDVRGMPFLTPVLDWLDSYDTVLSNLIDRTALARYLVWDVTVTGDQDAVDRFVTSRGGTHVPPSGSVEVHNDAVKWETRTAQTGAYEDSKATQAVLTNIASGTGLSKPWLAEPEDANRATSLTMAEPVRRRVAAVQKVWLGLQTELARFAVDRAVAARRLPATVTATDPRTSEQYEIPAAQAVTVTGPEVAAADAQITAQVLLNLSTGLEKLVAIRALTPEAAALAARKAWEDFVGVPYSADLGKSETNPDDLAGYLDQESTQPPRLVAVGH